MRSLPSQGPSVAYREWPDIFAERRGISCQPEIRLGVCASCGCAGPTWHPPGIALAENRKAERSAMREGLLAIRCYARLILLDAAAVVGYSPEAELLNVEAIKVSFSCRRDFPRIRTMGCGCCGFRCRGVREFHGPSRILVSTIYAGGTLRNRRGVSHLAMVAKWGSLGRRSARRADALSIRHGPDLPASGLWACLCGLWRRVCCIVYLVGLGCRPHRSRSV